MIFTPKESQAALDAFIAKTSLNFEDSSYINEGGDSCTIQIKDVAIFVGFPNVYGRVVNNESESSSFIVRLFHLTSGETIDLKWNEGKEDETENLTLDQAIDIINNYIKSI